MRKVVRGRPFATPHGQPTALFSGPQHPHRQSLHHWHLDGRDDDTPPGTQLAFELWQDETGAYTVRITVAMQTLRQLRTMPSLNLSAPPARRTLSLPACQTCGWEDFRKLTNAVIDGNDVFPMKAR